MSFSQHLIGIIQIQIQIQIKRIQAGSKAGTVRINVCSSQVFSHNFYIIRIKQRQIQKKEKNTNTNTNQKNKKRQQGLHGEN